jgi:hypothetical protein
MNLPSLIKETKLSLENAYIDGENKRILSKLDSINMKRACCCNAGIWCRHLIQNTLTKDLRRDHKNFPEDVQGRVHKVFFGSLSNVPLMSDDIDHDYQTFLLDTQMRYGHNRRPKKENLKDSFRSKDLTNSGNEWPIIFKDFHIKFLYRFMSCSQYGLSDTSYYFQLTPLEKLKDHALKESLVSLNSVVYLRKHLRKNRSSRFKSLPKELVNIICEYALYNVNKSMYLYCCDKDVSMDI